jgi:serine/threonine-protein kinase
MGVVIRATDVDLDRDVVVKFMRGNLGANHHMPERFRREAKTLAHMAHPRVLPLLDFGAEDGQLFTVHPFLPGSDLAARLREGLPAISLVMRWLQDALEGLAHVHGQGVIHRDIKPANLFVTEEDRLVLIDFGLARADGDATLTATATILGTPAYLDPAVVQGAPWSPSADVYALGVVAYRMLTGENPFLGVDLEETVRRHAGLVPRFPHEVRPEAPPRLSYLTMGMLEKEPRDRPSTEDALVDLREIASGDPNEVDESTATLDAPPAEGTAVLASTPSTARDSTRAWPGALAPLAGIILGSALLGVLLLGSPGPSPSPEPEMPTPMIEASPEVPAALSGLPQRARRELDARFDARAPGEVWGDPAGWARREGALDAPRTLVEWHLAGGDPATLPASFLAELQAVDSDARSLGGPPLFGALVRSAPEVPRASNTRVQMEQVIPEPWSRDARPSWRGTVLNAAARAEEVLDILQNTSMRTSSPGPLAPESLRPFLASWEADVILGGDRRFPFESVFLQGPLARRAMAAWMEQGIEATATMLYAAMRSQREERADPDLTQRVCHWIHELRPFLFSHLGMAPTDHLLGLAPRSPLEHLVVANLLEHQARPRRVLSSLDPSFGQAYRRSLREAFGVVRLEGRERQVALGVLVHRVRGVPEHLASRGQYLSMIGEFDSALLASASEERSRVWSQFAQLFEGRSDLPGARELLAGLAPPVTPSPLRPRPTP